jgi:hypothetical protein
MSVLGEFLFTIRETESYYAEEIYENGSISLERNHRMVSDHLSLRVSLYEEHDDSKNLSEYLDTLLKCPERSIYVENYLVTRALEESIFNG